LNVVSVTGLLGTVGYFRPSITYMSEMSRVKLYA
jgi:hypothetical protein